MPSRSGTCSGASAGVSPTPPRPGPWLGGLEHTRSESRTQYTVQRDCPGILQVRGGPGQISDQT